jgi:hypothetical protein
MSEMATNYGKNTNTTKISQYGWTVKDEPGELVLLHKNKLMIHPKYQRTAVVSKVRLISASWSWVAFGALIIGVRNGEYWVIDGQHRVLAARNRSDVQLLPCVIFETESIEQEARGFLDANTGRKPITGIDRFRASISAGEETAMNVDRVFRSLGISVSDRPTKGLETKSISWAMARSKENQEAFEDVIYLAAELCKNCPIQEILLGGLYYMRTALGIDFGDKRISDRIKKVGAIQLVESAKRASAFFTKGGHKVWATGMMQEINKGLRIKIETKEQ